MLLFYRTHTSPLHNYGSTSLADKVSLFRGTWCLKVVVSKMTFSVNRYTHTRYGWTLVRTPGTPGRRYNVSNGVSSWNSVNLGVLALARDAVSSLALGRPGEEKYYQHLEVSTQPG